MPMRKKWSKFTPKNISKAPNLQGGYEIANRNKNPIDIGGTRTSLKRRLNEKRKTRPLGAFFRFLTGSMFDSGFDIEKRHSTRYVKKHGRKPKYTKRSPKRRGWFNL